MRIEDVHAREIARSRINHETYKSIFEQCCQRIRRRVDMRVEPRMMAFHVPPIIWGRPPYTHAHAIRYVTEKLHKKGFKVTPGQHYGTMVVEWSRPPSPKPSKPARRTATKKSKKDPPLSSRLAALRKQLGG